MSNQKIIIKHSSGTTLPTLEVGELAINFKSGSETLYTKNSNDEIIGFNEWNKILNRPSSLIALVTGTQTAATSSWTGVLDSVSELYDGLTINYWLPYAGVSNATLNLTLSGGTTTGAINLYYGGTTRLTTHYSAGNIIQLTYRINANINGAPYTGWWAKANYDTSDNYTHRRYGIYKIGVGAIAANTIVAYDANGYIVNALTTNFDINQSILWCGTAYSANATGSNANIYEAHYNVSIAGTGFSGMTLYNPIFLKGTLYNNMFTAISLTQTIPSSEDGFIYILVGAPQNTTNTIQFFFKNQLFTYVDGAFRQFTPHSGIANKLSASRTIWGQNFDGTSNVSGDLNGVSSIIRNHPYAVDSDVYGNLNWKVDAESWFNWNVGGILNVNKGGNVGIGIGTPESKLHVIGEIKIESHNSTTGAINIQGNSTSCGFGFGNTESVNNMGFIKFKPTAVNSGSVSNRIAFDIYGNDDIVSILGSGNVGIGTTSPSYKLDVNGATRIFGGLHLNSEGWLNLYNSANTSRISISHNSSSSKLDIYNRTSSTWASVEAGFITVDTITMKNNQSEKFIRSNAFGGAIRLRADGASAVDRGLQLGRVDNNLSFSSFMAINADSGNVSINSTLDNGYKLDVAGTFRINYNYSTTFTGNDINFTRTDGSSYINAGQTLSLGAGGTSGVLNLTNANVATFKELLLADGARIYSTAGSGLGISLFNESSYNPNYGLMFAQTVYKGKHGSVNGDWATYFTMSPDAGRGWIFTNSASSSNGNVASISNTGNFTASGEVTAYSASDIRLKANIKPIDSAIDVINKLNPVQYNWNTLAKELNPLKTDSTEYGLIAQELEKVMPELVHEIYGKYKSIDYVKLVPILIKGMQELKAEINELKNK